MSSNSSSMNWTSFGVQNLILVNLVAFLPQLSLSALITWLLIKTSLLHPNMKLILLSQSASFTLFAFTDIWRIFSVLIYGNRGVQSGMFMQILSTFSIFYLNFIGHVLLIERVIATWMADRYEYWRKPYFTICWFTALFLYSLYNALPRIHTQMVTSTGSIGFNVLIAGYIAIAMSFTEIILCFVIGTQNNKRYKIWVKHCRHNLSERYQLSENIQTARQLAPTFVLHFINVTMSISTVFIMYYQLITDAQLVMLQNLFYHFVLAISNGLIEYTLISRHPILRRNAIQLFIKMKRKMPCFARNNNQIGDANHTNYTSSESITNHRPTQNEIDQHFEMLRMAWEI